MKRLIDAHLLAWQDSPIRRPLLIRGARQVGKTYAARQLAKAFDDYVEINLENGHDLKNVFEKDLNPERIVRELSLIAGKPILPGRTLLFFDEIQASPRAFQALRYFYELMPELHVIAAGSLLDFTIEKIGIPVGRVMSLYMYPMSFFEFLEALDETLVAEEILKHDPHKEIGKSVHAKLLNLLGEYLAIGGMPEAVACWQETKDPLNCFEIHQLLINAYRQDFDKYAKKFQLKYVRLLFERAPLKLGKKFKYSSLGEYRKRELEPSLDLLETAGIIHKVYQSDGNGVPLGAEADPADFKVIFLDVALSQAILNLNVAPWILNPLEEFVNKGELVESFIGQELLAYAEPSQKAQLYYWRKAKPGSQAEVDYLIQRNQHVIPVEVKSGKGRSFKSLKIFLDNRPKTPFGIKLSLEDYSVSTSLVSYPLYAVAGILKPRT